MARMHTRRKGASKSKKPLKSLASEWVTYSQADIEEMIVKLAKEGQTPSNIGMILRDQYGIPDVRPIIGLKINQVLDKKGMTLKIPEDLQSLINKVVILQNHKKDNHNKRALMLMESKIRRLAKYYIKVGKLPTDWRYDIENARLLAAK
jgi:small subunit ribosomal protein S15